MSKSTTPAKIFVPMNKRPQCTHRGCNEPQQLTGHYRKDGTPCFRKLCAKHHSEKTAAKHGMSSLKEVVAAKLGMTPNEYQQYKLEKRAKKAGFDNIAEFLNSKHPYRKHRKDYCENRDSRLGFKCNYKIRHPAQLQVDHKNGKPDDNRPRNLQTLCANCHTFKTHANKDYASPGRKALKEAGMFTKFVNKK
jgi:hypothetical protein